MPILLRARQRQKAEMADGASWPSRREQTTMGQMSERKRFPWAG